MSLEEFLASIRRGPGSLSAQKSKPARQSGKKAGRPRKVCLLPPVNPLEALTRPTTTGLISDREMIQAGAAYLRRIRESLRLTRLEFAKRYHTCEQTIAKIERAEGKFVRGTLLKLYQALCADPALDHIPDLKR